VDSRFVARRGVRQRERRVTRAAIHRPNLELEQFGFRIATRGDITGFIDGTEKPAHLGRADVALIPDGDAGRRTAAT